MRLLQSRTSKSGRCEAFKPYLVQCAYFSHIRPNLADAKLWSRFWFNAPTSVTYAQIRSMPQNCNVFVQCAYFNHIRPNPVDAKFSSRIWVNASTLVTVPNTSKSSWCKALKPFLVQCAYFRRIRPNLADATKLDFFLVQCAYFSHIRPNLANAKLSSRIWFNAPTLGTYAQIQLMWQLGTLFGSMRLL